LQGFGLRFSARGSHRPGRLPTRWYATALSISSTSLARRFGRAASNFGAKSTAAVRPPRSLPICSQFFRPSAIGRIARSAALLSIDWIMLSACE
jgi:hypothetical protein